MMRGTNWNAQRLLLRSCVVSAWLLMSCQRTHSQGLSPINAELVPLGVDTFVVSHDGNIIGHGIIARSRTNPKRLLQVYKWQGVAGDETVDSLFSDLTTLRPMREVRVVSGILVEVAYAPDSIRVQVGSIGGDSRKLAFANAASTYSSAGLEALTAAAPLALTYDGEFRVYYPPPAERGFTTIRLQVRSSEEVRDRMGRVRDAWVVTASTPGGGTVFWIDKVSRAILRYETREGSAVIQFLRLNRFPQTRDLNPPYFRERTKT